MGELVISCFDAIQNMPKSFSYLQKKHLHSRCDQIRLSACSVPCCWYIKYAVITWRTSSFTGNLCRVWKGGHLKGKWLDYRTNFVLNDALRAGLRFVWPGNKNVGLPWLGKPHGGITDFIILWLLAEPDVAFVFAVGFCVCRYCLYSNPKTPVLLSQPGMWPSGPDRCVLVE